MCGFLGVHNNESISLNTLKSSLDLLIHRGKDSTNIKYIESLKSFFLVFNVCQFKIYLKMEINQ